MCVCVCVRACVRVRVPLQIASTLANPSAAQAVVQLVSCDTIFSNFTLNNDTGLQRLLDFDGECDKVGTVWVTLACDQYSATSYSAVTQ